MRGVTPESLAATAALRGALRVALTEEPPAATWSVPAEVSSSDFLTAIKRHRVFPLLARYPDRFDFKLELTAKIAEGDKTERLNSLRVTQQLIKAQKTLTHAGIRTLAFKGPALAQLAYGDFTIRGTGDIDLLVSPDDLEAAYDTLETAGWIGDSRMPRPGPSWAWRHIKRRGYEVSLNGPAMIDLHWLLVNDLHAFPSFNDLWKRRSEVRIGGADISTLCRWDSLAHTCSHAAKDDWSWLRSIADIYALAHNPATWATFDRPLSEIQTTSLGIAALSFGVPESSPQILNYSARRARTSWRRAHHRQAGQAIRDRTGDLPGEFFIDSVLSAYRRSGSTRSAIRTATAALVPADYLGGVIEPTFLASLPGLISNRRRSITNSFIRWRSTK